MGKKWPSSIVKSNEGSYRESKQSNYVMEYWALYNEMRNEFKNREVTFTYDKSRKQEYFNLARLRLEYLGKMYPEIVFKMLNREGNNRVMSKSLSGYDHYTKNELDRKGELKETREGKMEYVLKSNKILKKISDGSYESSHIVTQYPLNIFIHPKSKDNRMYPQFWIDILALDDNSNSIDIFELKQSDVAQYDLISQGLDYLFIAHKHKDLLAKFWGKKDIKTIRLYFVSNAFHPNFQPMFKDLKERISTTFKDEMSIYKKTAKITLNIDIDK